MFEVSFVDPVRVVAVEFFRPSDAFHVEVIARAEELAKVHDAPIAIYAFDERIAVIDPVPVA